jgi:hypothetical protein
VVPEDLPRFHTAINSAVRARNSAPVEVALAILVWTVGHWLRRSQVAIGTATWYAMPQDTHLHLTLAGYCQIHSLRRSLPAREVGQRHARSGYRLGRRVEAASREGSIRRCRVNRVQREETCLNLAHRGPDDCIRPLGVFKKYRSRRMWSSIQELIYVGGLASTRPLRSGPLLLMASCRPRAAGRIIWNIHQ